MFKNRIDAGRVLAEMIAQRKFSHPLVLAIPRGGIVVAAPIAQKLNIKIDVLVTRKIGHPQNPEVAIGAVMPDGSAVTDEVMLHAWGISSEYIKNIQQREYTEILRRMDAYTGSRQAPDVANKQAIIVDDGIATGYTIKAAVKWLKKLKPDKIVIAVPVAPPDTVFALSGEVDEIICPLQPRDFMAVGMYYEDFSQTSDQEAIAILKDVNRA